MTNKNRFYSQNFSDSYKNYDRRNYNTIFYNNNLRYNTKRGTDKSVSNNYLKEKPEIEKIQFNSSCNDKETKIALDTGASKSYINLNLLKKSKYQPKIR